jgi:hypothetical protein
VNLTCAQTPPTRQEKPKARKLFWWSQSTITAKSREHKKIAAFVEACIDNLPRQMQKRLIFQYCKRYISPTAKNAERSANIFLRETTDSMQDKLKAVKFNDMQALYREDKLKLEAAFAQMSCRQAIIQPKGNMSYEDKLKVAFDDCAKFAARYSIHSTLNSTKASAQDYESALVRFDDDEWWYRKLNTLRLQTLEYLEIAAGNVGKKKVKKVKDSNGKKQTIHSHHQEYASNFCVAEYRKQRKNNDEYLKLMDVVNLDTLDTIPLNEIADKTASNPEIRRIELMVRCRGLEDYADELGYESFFVTWTAPSKYHKNSAKWSDEKQNRKGVSPSETQSYLCGQWQKCRAKIHRNGVDWFGVRVAEPHIDSTPHWHMLIFCKPDESSTMQSIIREYALEHDSDEGGAQENRIDVKAIDRSKGSATGYIAKYIAKNINAKHSENEPDFDGSGSLSDSAVRVLSWASRWKIRQFQFFGTASVSVYRELRRIKNPLVNKALESVRAAADSGKWDAFVKAIALNPVKLSYQDDETNKYGETVKKVDGVISQSISTLTRLVKFALKKRGAGALSGGSRATWSTVNNCTQSVIHSTKDTQTKAMQVLSQPEFVKTCQFWSAVKDETHKFSMQSGQAEQVPC